MKWVQRCKNAEHFACLVSTCTNGHLVQKSTAVVFLRGHMNSWGQNFLQQGPFHLEQAFSAMSDAVFTCRDKTNLFNTVQLPPPPHKTKNTFPSNFAVRKRLNLRIILRRWLISNAHHGDVFLQDK